MMGILRMVADFLVNLASATESKIDDFLADTLKKALDNEAFADWLNGLFNADGEAAVDGVPEEIKQSLEAEGISLGGILKLLPTVLAAINLLKGIYSDGKIDFAGLLAVIPQLLDLFKGVLSVENDDA